MCYTKISPNDFDNLGEITEENSNNTILKVRDKKSGKILAIKVTSLKNDQLKKMAKNEAQIMTILKYPNIINYVGSFTDANRGKFIVICYLP